MTETKRKYTKRRRVSYGGAPKAALATKAYVLARTRKPEQKWLAGQLSAVVLTGTVMQSFLNPLVPGAARNQRIGNRVQLEKLTVNVIASAATGVQSRLRVVIAIDKQPNGATVSPGQLWADPTAVNWHYAIFDPNTVPSRFRILRDFWMDFPIFIAAAGAGFMPAHKRCVVPLKTMVQYNEGSAGTTADVIDGAVYFFAFTDVAANGPTVAFEYVLKFTDV